MLIIVSGIANYFIKSNYGTFHLYVWCKTEGIQEGIKCNLETLFSSSYLQVVSVHKCMSPIKKCIASKTLKFDTKAVSQFQYDFSQFPKHESNSLGKQTKKLLPYIQEGALRYLFMGQMSGFIQVLLSMANAILTLWRTEHYMCWCFLCLGLHCTSFREGTFITRCWAH